MLDLIRDTLRFDFAMTFTNAIGLVYSVMGDNLQNAKENITSSLRSHEKLDQAYIDKIYETYAKIKQQVKEQTAGAAYSPIARQVSCVKQQCNLYHRKP